MAFHDKHIPWPVSTGFISLVILLFAAVIDHTSGHSLKPIDYGIYEAFIFCSILSIPFMGIALVICTLADVNALGVMVEKGKAHIATGILSVCVASICLHVIYVTELKKTKTVTYIDVNSADPNVKTSFTKSTLFSTVDGVMDCAKLFGLGKIDEKRHFSLVETHYYTTYGILPRVDFEYALIELPMGVEKLPDDKDISNLAVLKRKELSLQ